MLDAPLIPVSVHKIKTRVAVTSSALFVNGENVNESKSGEFAHIIFVTCNDNAEFLA